MLEKLHNGWLGMSVLFISSMVMLVGCAANYENGRSYYDPDQLGELSQNEREEVYASLSHKGQFTEVAILKNLHDSSFDVSGSGMDSVLPQQDKRDAIPHEKNVQAVHTPPSHEEVIPQDSPLLVHLPSGPSKIEGQDEQWHKDLGWSLLIEGNYEGAAAAYREALRQNQDSAEAYLGLGSSLRMQHHIPAAIEAYEHAIQLQPDYTAALVHLGSIYAEGGPEHQDIDRAKQMYARASEQGDPFAKIALKDLNNTPKSK